MLLSNLKIRGKLLLTLVTVAVITLGATAIGEFQVTRAALERSSFDRLTAVREMKAQQIEEYFETISDLVLSFAETESTRNALANFALAFRIIEGQATRRDNDPGARDTVAAENDNLMSYYSEEFYPRLARNLVDPATAGPDQFYPSGVASRYLQNLYISANPQPVDEKHLLASVGDGSVYDNLHARYHSSFLSYLDRFGFYDIFLVEPQDGIIVYSVFKEVDFATSLLTGPYSESGLADVVRQALASDEPGELFISDFSSYAPSYNAPAAFIATPVFMGGDMIGVVAFQMPIDRINQIMTSQNSWSDVGLGQTGETYIVGSDFRMRNQSRFLIDDPEGYFEAIRLAGVTEATIQAIRNFDSTVGLQEVRTPGTVAALTGVASTEIFPDYRGVNVLSSYRPLALDGLDWVIMSEIDEAEAFAPIEALKRTTLLIGSGIFAFIAMMSFFIARAVARPIKELTERAEALATGDLSTRIEAIGRDEVHLLAKSFESMRMSLRELIEGLEQKVRERTKALSDSLSFVTTLVDSVPNPIFVKDTSGRYLNFNKAYENTFGIRREDIIGKTVKELEFFPEEYRNMRHEEDVQLLRDGGSSHREVNVVLTDGTAYDMLFWARAFDLSDGSRGGVLGVFVDIGQQKELERQLAIANKRMGDELNIGRQIQMSMIPLTFPRFPEHKDLDVWAYIRPAREVGGDFYDFFMIDDRYFAFVIADVSGKGVPAALMMAVAKTMLKSRAQDTKSTANIISATNNELSENNEECMFITAFFGIVDTKTGILTYTNAGHNPPYLLKTDGTMQVLGEMHGPMVGVMPAVPYGEAQTKLDVDDKIVLYTDGITEAFDARGIDYGEKRLEECLQRSHQLGTKYLVEAMVRDVDDFVADAEQSDDITLFCLRYVAWDVRDARGTVELRLANKLPEIDRCLQALAEICQRFELPPNIQQDFSVVLDDLLNNVISYAFSDAKEHIIDVVLSTDGQRFIVSVADDGVEFDPFTRKDPDILSGIEDREIGGLGIHLIRNLMDDYSYRRLDGRNVTTLMKRFATNTSGNSDETKKH